MDVSRNIYVAKPRRRIAAFLIDYLTCGILGSLLVVLFWLAVPSAADSRNAPHAFWLFIVGLLLLKDALGGGRSIGKRLFKLHLFKAGTEEPLPWLRTLPRNLPLLLGPIEILVLLISRSGRRIGDRFVGSHVYTRNLAHARQSPPGKSRIFLSIGIMLALVLLFVVIEITLKNSGAYQAAVRGIQNHPEIREEIGTVRGFGWLLQGSISTSGASGSAAFSIKTKGERGQMTLHVGLVNSPMEDWHVTSINWKDR